VNLGKLLLLHDPDRREAAKLSARRACDIVRIVRQPLASVEVVSTGWDLFVTTFVAIEPGAVTGVVDARCHGCPASD
jgi:hypothetical protein